MASKHKMLILTLLEVLAMDSLSRSIDHAAAQDTFPVEATLEPYECPYPCLPPPTATTTPANCPPPPRPPPPPASSSPPYKWQYPPPASSSPPYTWQYPPPAGYYGNNYFAPPPPDPILPYFPFYYKNPPPPFELSSVGGESPLTASCILFIAQIFIRLL